MKVADKKAYERYLAKLELIKSSATVNPFESEADKKARIERFKVDFGAMVAYYFPHYCTSKSADFHIKWANKVAKNKTFKGFAEWGRGLAKSVENNIYIPFWLWLRGEPVYFVLIGQNADKGKQLLDDLRAEFEANARIINDFGEQKQMGTWEDGFFITTGGFIGQSLGTGQSTRGLRVKEKRPTHINFDDLETRDITKNQKRQDEIVEWIEREVVPIMDGPIRRVTYSNTRHAPRMIQTVLQEKHPKWKVHSVPAYDKVSYEPAWKEKYTPEYYKSLEEEIGRLACLAEYCMEPHVEGKIFTDEMIQWCRLPRLDHMKHIVGFWDVAYAGTPKSDFNAVRIWGVKDTNFYYINSFVKQSKMKAALHFMADVQKNLPESVIIHWKFESQFWNGEVERTIDEVERFHNIKLNLVKKDTPKTKKYDRILSMHPYYQNGRIWYNEKMKSHNDTAVGLAQLKAVEPGSKEHDDAPDADQQAIEELSKYIRVNNSPSPVTGIVASKNRW